MKSILSKLTLTAAALATMAAFSTTAVAAEKVVLGVAIPAATHGFTGGIVFWANQAKKDLEAANPDLKVIVKTAANAAEQANQLQDLMAVSKINALVVFPNESAAHTRPVAEGHNKGVYATVVARLLDRHADPEILGAVAGNDVVLIAPRHISRTRQAHAAVVRTLEQAR